MTAPDRTALRDQLAAQAMQGLLASQRVYLLDPATVARDAYRVADEMLARREQKDPGHG